MFSGLLWLMFQCTVSMLAAQVLKPSLYTDCISNSDLRSHCEETEWETELAGRCCEEVESGINRCRGIALCQADLWRLLSVSWCCSLTQTQADTHIPAAGTAGTACAYTEASDGFSTQHHQWCTYKIITRVRVLSREGRPWCWLLIASGRIRGYVSNWKWCNVTSVRVDWRAFICKKKKESPELENERQRWSFLLLEGEYKFWGWMGEIGRDRGVGVGGGLHKFPWMLPDYISFSLLYTAAHRTNNPTKVTHCITAGPTWSTSPLFK